MTLLSFRTGFILALLLATFIANPIIVAKGNPTKKTTKQLLRKFSKKDIKKTTRSLMDAGVERKTVKGNLGILLLFANSQGHRTFGKAMAALFSGRVKAGRGIENVDILRIEKISESLGNVMAANVTFQIIIDILKESDMKRR